MTKNAIIVQARLGSTRLPKKMLLELGGKTILEFLLERLQDTPLVDALIVATTDLPEDDPLEKIVHKMNISLFRGSATDVLKRYYDAAIQFKVDTIVRICGDNVFLETPEISRLLKINENDKGEYDYIANALPDKTPLILTGTGLAVEVFSIAAVEKMLSYPHTDYHREHVTPFFYRNPDLFNLRFTPPPFEILPEMRLTLDVRQDYENICEIYQSLNSSINIQTISAFLKQNPELLRKMKTISMQHQKTAHVTKG